MFDCVEMANSGVCDELEATPQKAPGQFVNLARKVIANDAKKYTGDTILSVDVTTVTHESGTRVEKTVQSEIGKITFALVQFPHNLSWARTWK